MQTRLMVWSCLAILAAFALAQSDEGYQSARVVAFDRVSADAQHMENQDQYKISMRMGDTVYNCHASGSAAIFNDWTINKEFPAKLNGKELLVKNPDGQIVELKIVGKKSAK